MLETKTKQKPYKKKKTQNQTEMRQNGYLSQPSSGTLLHHSGMMALSLVISEGKNLRSTQDFLSICPAWEYAWLSKFFCIHGYFLNIFTGI